MGAVPLSHRRAEDRFGATYEDSLDDDVRRARGAWFTPPDLADRLAEKTFDGLDVADLVRVCDPAVGGGAFLLAVARLLERRGLDRRTIVESCLWGVDVDPAAVDVAVSALVSWAGHEADGDLVRRHVRTADALADDEPFGPDTRPFDVVVGNPPFQNQLERATVRSAADRTAMRRRFGDAVSTYTDSSALFLLAALDLAPCGRVALILPDSFLVARDAGAVRAVVGERARLLDIWFAEAQLFRAAVDVCAPVLAVGDPSGGRVRRWVGPSFDRLPAAASPVPDGGPWSSLRPAATALPSIAVGRGRRLGELTTATAGFRDQYYGLDGCVLEGERPDRQRPALVTSGLVDPATCHWGRRPARFAGVRWHRPVVDLDRLEGRRPDVAAWARARLRPKVLLATQTRVLEAAVDRDGSWYPSTPVVAVEPELDQLWRVAAVLLAPPVSVWALGTYGGGALHRDAVKLSARQVLEVPLPVDEGAWTAAADRLEAATGPPDPEDLVEVGRLLCRAYRAGEDVLGWWLDRLPAGVRSPVV